MTGIKGKRVPGRPGRFDPSMPLHMTTRRSAQKPNASDTSPRDNTSTEDGASRRASFEDSCALGLYDDYSREPSPKRQRTGSALSHHSISPPLMTDGGLADASAKTSGLFVTDDGRSSAGEKTSNGRPRSRRGADSQIKNASKDRPVARDGAQSELKNSPDNIFVEEDDDEPIESRYRSKAAREEEQRRRYESVNGTHIEDEETMIYTKNGPIKTFAQVDESYQPRHEGDWIEVIPSAPSARLTNSSREESIASSRSDEPMDDGPELPPASTNETPLATRQGSPATTASGAAELETPVRAESVVLGLAGSDDEGEDDEGEDDEDEDGGVGNEDDEEDEDDDQDGENLVTTRKAVEEAVETPANGDEEECEGEVVRRVMKRRYAPGGRRRAVHSDVAVEAAMRRQLELKQFYRQVTRAMKTCLGELAQITLDELETDPDVHKTNAEYDAVIAGLNARLGRRKSQLLAAQRLNEQQLQQRRLAEEFSRKNRCGNFLADLKAQQLSNLEYNMLQIERTRQLGEKQPGHETEDEDGAVLRPKRMAYKFRRSEALDSRYDSRSRLIMETEARIDDLSHRSSMHEALKAFATASGGVEGFTVMDRTARSAAEERRNNTEGTAMLAQAAEVVRKQDAAASRPPPTQPSAAEMVPLQMLSELATHPQIDQLLPSRQQQVYQPPPVFAPGYPHNAPPRRFHPPAPFFEHPAHRRAMSEMPPTNMYPMAPPHTMQTANLESPFLNRHHQTEGALAHAQNSHAGVTAPPAFSPQTSHSRANSISSHRDSISSVHPDRLKLIPEALKPQNHNLTNEVAQNQNQNQKLGDGSYRGQPPNAVRRAESEQLRSSTNFHGQPLLGPTRPANLPINSRITLNGAGNPGGNSGAPHNTTSSGSDTAENQCASTSSGAGNAPNISGNGSQKPTSQQDSTGERRASFGPGTFGNKKPAWKPSKDDRKGLSRREHKKLAREDRAREERVQRDRAATIGHGFRPDGPPLFESEANRRSSAFAGPPPMYQGPLSGPFAPPPFMAPWGAAHPPPPPPYGLPPFLHSQTQAVNHFAAGFPPLAPRPGPPQPQPPYRYPVVRRDW